MNIEPILKKNFYHDGRGPELQKVYYSGRGTILQAIDYFNPDDEYVSENLKHLLIKRAKVSMFTPEEVNNYRREIDWSRYDKAAAVCFGKSIWLESFSAQYLSKCFHYRVMFYDEFLDVICEGIETKLGRFASDL